jgi:hypothetical protein
LLDAAKAANVYACAQRIDGLLSLRVKKGWEPRGCMSRRRRGRRCRLSVRTVVNEKWRRMGAAFGRGCTIGGIGEWTMATRRKVVDSGSATATRSKEERTAKLPPPPAALAMPAAQPPSARDEMLRELLRVMQAVRDGDFSVTMPGDWSGMEGKLADTLNEIVFNNRRLANELEIGLRRDEHTNARAKERLVIDKGNADHEETSRENGIVA